MVEVADGLRYEAALVDDIAGGGAADCRYGMVMSACSSGEGLCRVIEGFAATH